MNSKRSALGELIDKMRSMAADYRKWANETSGFKADEFRQLAESSEHSANELDKVLRQQGEH